MPGAIDNLERQVLGALQQALADKRMDVADHLLRALEALDSDRESAARQAVLTRDDAAQGRLEGPGGG